MPNRKKKTITENGGDGTVKASEPNIPDEDKTIEAKTEPLEASPQNMIQAINQLNENQKLLAKQLQDISKEVFSMRGAYSQSRINTAANPTDPAQEAPQIPPILLQLAQIVVGALSSRKEEDTAVTMISRRINDMSQQYVLKVLENALKLQEAGEQGHVLIQKSAEDTLKEGPK